MKMNIIPSKLWKTGFLFSWLVVSLLTFQPAPQATATGIDPPVSAARWLPGSAAPRPSFPARPSSSPRVSGAKSPAQIDIRPGWGVKIETKAGILVKAGPVFAAAFSMSNFSVSGFVKDRWPIVIDYELEADSTAEVTIKVKDSKQPFVIHLESTNDQRKVITSNLPEGFGKKPQVGEPSFAAFKTGPGQRQPTRFFLYGMGVGDKAVGSMVIDQLQFQPGSVRSKLKERARYSFRSTSDFDTVSADFMLVTLSSGVVHAQLAFREVLKNGVRRSESVARDWDGKNSKGKISQGPHQFRVRVWRGLKNGGDWAFASAKEVVRVE